MNPVKCTNEACLETWKDDNYAEDITECPFCLESNAEHDFKLIVNLEKYTVEVVSIYHGVVAENAKDALEQIIIDKLPAFEQHRVIDNKGEEIYISHQDGLKAEVNLKTTPKTNKKIQEENREQKYLNSKANKCPVCESNNISACGSVQTDNTGAWQEIICDNCGATWQDVYELTGIYNLKENKKWKN